MADFLAEYSVKLPHFPVRIRHLGVPVDNSAECKLKIRHPHCQYILHLGMYLTNIRRVQSDLNHRVNESNSRWESNSVRKWRKGYRAALVVNVEVQLRLRMDDNQF